MVVLLLMAFRGEYLIQNLLEHFASAVTDPVIALMGTDSLERGDENAEVLDRLGAGDGIHGCGGNGIVFLLQELSGEDTGGGEAVEC